MSKFPCKPYCDDAGVPRVAVGVGQSGPFAYRPGRVLLDFENTAELEKGLPAVARVLDLEPKALGVKIGLAGPRGFVTIEIDPSKDVLKSIENLNNNDDVRASGIGASIDTVVSAHALKAAPVHLNPVHLNPVHLNPVHLNGQLVTDPSILAGLSTARPWPSAHLAAHKRPSKASEHVMVVVVDTGIPKSEVGNSPGAWLIAGELADIPDDNTDDFLDAAAGHNGFIQGIVGHTVAVDNIDGVGALENDGDGADSEVAEALAELAGRLLEDERAKSTTGRLPLDWVLINLSFGGYYPDDTPPPAMAKQIRRLHSYGAVVVASAGNDGDCRPTFPAAMDEVVGVGSVGACGPSWFSNHGSWVDASAPGEDVVSDFFNWNGLFGGIPALGMGDPDRFEGSAIWSGTSFAAPRVVAALANEMRERRATAREAKQIILDRPGLFRLPDYGVIVNQGF